MQNQSFQQAPIKPFNSAAPSGISLNPQPVLSPIQPQQPVSQPTSQSTPQISNSVPQGLDPIAYTLTKAIGLQESGGDYTAQGKSGEYGAYQNIPGTWAARSAAAGINVPINQATPEQQNEVMYKWVSSKLAAGYTPAEVASMQNAGEGAPDAYKGNSGTNAEGVKYDTAAYVQEVQKYAEQLFNQSQTAPQASQNAPGAAQDPSLGGFGSNILSSGANFAGNLLNAVAHPLQTGQNLLETGAGALQEAGGQTNDNTAKFDQLKDYFVNRYGGISNLEHTLYTDPVGFAADLSTVLGTGAGALGIAGKAAELGGLGSAAIDAGGADFIAGAEGTGGISQSTEASGLAGGLKIASNALGTGAKYTNPLTPAVAVAGALLNKTADLSDIIANPKNYTAENIANSSAEAITKDVENAIQTNRDSLSETGAGYAPFRETPVSITTAPADLDNILRDSLKVNVTDGVIEPNSTSLIRDQASINKLQGVYNTFKSDFLKGSMDSEKLLNLRTDLAKIAYNDLGIKNTDVAKMAAKVRGAVNNTYRAQVPGLADLDTEYSGKLDKLDELQDGLIYKTGSNKGELKTSFINSAGKAVKNGDTDKLAQLEELVPGITKRLQVMKTIKELGDPSFTTSLVEKGGVVGGLLTGNIKGAALALTSIILSKPSIAVPLLRAVGANMELVKTIMANLSKSVTAGAVQNNVQQSTPQQPQEQTANAPGAAQDQQLETQSGNSSDLNQLAVSKGFDLAAARKAGYSDQDIQQFLAQN